MDLKKIQPQGICYHAEAGKAHCRSPEHRIQRPAENGDPHTCGKGDADDVVEKCPEKIFVDIAQGSPA